MLGEEELNAKHIVLWDPTVGTQYKTLDDHGPGAIAAKDMPSPSPKEMTPAQRARHWITRLPYDPGCGVCVSCKRPNQGHIK